MKNIIIVLLLSCFGLSSMAGVESRVGFKAFVMPDNVHFDMTYDAVRLARPEANNLQMGTGSRNTNAVVATEILMNGAAFTSFQYQFIGDRLRAVTKSLFHANMRDETLINSIHSAIAKDLARQPDEKIVRLNENMQPILIAVELWKNMEDGTCVYFVDTTKDTTIITFDPQYLALKDFFISPDEMPQITPTLESVRKNLEAAEKGPQLLLPQSP